MATGDVKWFAQGLLDLGFKRHDLSSDVLKVGLIKVATTPTIGTVNPTWGAAGTDMSVNQVSTGGTSYTGPITVAGASWALDVTVPKLRFNIITLLQDILGFTDARWAILFNDTDANKRCLSFMDFGLDRSIVTGELELDWFGVNNDVLSLTQS